MPYSSGTAVREYISAGGLATFGTDVVGTLVMSDAIADSANIIDMMLSKRYETPFVSPYPPVIPTIEKVLSGWRVLRSVYSGEMPSSLAFVEDDYKKAMSWLEDLRDSKMDLPSGAASGGVIAEKGASTLYYSNTKDYTPIFDVDSELNWKVDTNRISDIGDARA